MDLLVDVQRPDGAALDSGRRTTSAEVRAAVHEARERQAARLAGTGLLTNAQLTAGLVRERVQADDGAHATLRAAYEQGQLSTRGHGRILRVARTIADLDGSARVRSQHIVEALGWRQEDVLDGARAAA
jgi:magnesium chelatase family protein